MAASTNGTNAGTEADQNQAIEAAEATDKENIIRQLPEDIDSERTKRAFSPGTIRKLLIDCYYAGPIGIGRGGWRGLYGGGSPGTEMRRPHGALYNFPRSWRFASLKRALETGIITHVGGGKFATTERGVSLLKQIDVCDNCEKTRVPMVQKSTYIRSPTSETHIESRKLVTECPECGANGYSSGNSTQEYEEFERSEERIKYATDQIAAFPEAVIYGTDHAAVSADAVDDVPETDPDAITDLLETVVEDHVPGEPRDLFGSYDSDQYDREVVTIPSNGDLYRFSGTEEAIAVSRRDDPAEVHFTHPSDSDMLVVNMSYETAVDDGAKTHIKAGDCEWTGDEWVLDPDSLSQVIGTLTYTDEHSTAFEVTVSENALQSCSVPVFGVDEDGELV